MSNFAHIPALLKTYKAVVLKFHAILSIFKCLTRTFWTLTVNAAWSQGVKKVVPV